MLGLVHRLMTYANTSVLGKNGYLFQNRNSHKINSQKLTAKIHIAKVLLTRKDTVTRKHTESSDEQF